MQTRIRNLVGVSALIVAAFAASGCGAEDEIAAVEDCASVCNEYSECVEDIDVTECTDRCEDMAESDASQSALDQCDDCIEETSCAEAAACIPECPIIPTPED